MSPMTIDVHQHLWTEPLVEALRARSELPFISTRRGCNVLHIAGENAHVLELDGESPARRSELLRRDGVQRALVALSSPIGVEALARREAGPVLDAYLDGALAAGDQFGVWGAVALDGAGAGDVDRVLDRGCVGLSLPAGALADVDALARVRPLLARLQERDAPLLVHPGDAPWSPRVEASLADPLWWPALTRYVAQMQAAWLAFAAAGRRTHPHLRVVFAMLAGGAPLHFERLAARGGPALCDDPLTFYDSSSYGPTMLAAMIEVVGVTQIVYGSDRPVVECDHRCPAWSPLLRRLAENSQHALAGVATR